MRRRSLIALAIAGAFAAGAAHAQISDNVIKIGVLSDMSSLYTDLAGAGSVAAARMAVEDSGTEKRGYKVEIVSADHQNKPDVGSAIARQWYDTDKVDVIVDVPNSGVALAVNQITRDKGKAFLVSGAASSDLTGKACSPNTIHWTYDTWMLANGTGSAIVKTGGDTWFFLTADYAFGQALERDTEAVVLKNGGKVLGAVRHPLNNQDFSSFLLQAQATIEYRWADDNNERLPAFAADLASRRVDVIFANSPSIAAALAATKTIPIIFNTGDDPVRLGFVASLNRPGGNATGVTIFSNELAAKRLDLLRELVPHSKTIAVLINSDFGPSGRFRADIEAAARALGVATP